MSIYSCIVVDFFVLQAHIKTASLDLERKTGLKNLVLSDPFFIVKIYY